MMLDITTTTILTVGIGTIAGGYLLWRQRAIRVVTVGAARAMTAPALSLPSKDYKRILVPTGVGMCHDDFVTEAASLACQLAKPGGNAAATEVLFTYVIPVPRALALNASLPAEEAEAEQVLNAAAALAKKRGLSKVTTQLRKGRTVVDETLKAVEQEAADLVILTPQTHAAAQIALPFDKNRDAARPVPATQAAIHAGVGAGVNRAEPCTTSRCYAELDTVETSDASETVTGKLLRRLPCEAIVARRASTQSSALPVEFSRN